MKVLADFHRDPAIGRLIDSLPGDDMPAELGSFETFFQFSLGLAMAKEQNGSASRIAAITFA